MEYIMSKTLLNEYMEGISIISSQEVLIIGEQKMMVDGKILEQWIYNIKGYACKNGEPFVALKCNIALR